MDGQLYLTTGIVVPCYNESKRLQVGVIEDFLLQHPEVSLLFVDDGSRDCTAEILTELVQKWPRQVFAWSLETNCGKAEAVRRGILKGIEMGFSQIGFWDADMATPLASIPEFCRVLANHPEIDVVWGARMPLLGRRIRRERKRYLLGRICSNLSALAIRLPVYDISCGAKLFRNGNYLNIVFQERFYSRWIFDVEILSRLNRYRKSSQQSPASEVTYELPVDQWSEIAGSKIRAGTFLRSGMELLVLALKYRWESYPSTDASLSRRIEPVKLHELRPVPVQHTFNKAA